MIQILKRLLILFLVVRSIIPGIIAQEYVVHSGYDSHILPLSTVSSIPEEIQIGDLPLWILISVIGIIIIETLFFLKIWTFYGYRRIMQSNVLAHPVRFSIFLAIVHNPGIHLQSLARETKIHISTLRYHLHQLMNTGKITCCQDAATIQFFENNGTYTKTQKLVFKHIRNETRSKILYYLIKEPNTGRNKLASWIGCTGASISWHMRLLETDGLIHIKRNGRTIIYHIPADVSSFLNELNQNTYQE